MNQKLIKKAISYGSLLTFTGIVFICGMYFMFKHAPIYVIAIVIGSAFSIPISSYFLYKHFERQEKK